MLLLSVQSIQIFDILLIPAEQVSKSVDHIFSATYLSDSLSMPVLGFSFWQCSASWVWIEHFADDTDADVNLHKKLLGVKFCLLQRSDGLKKRRRRNLQMQIMLTKKPLTMLSRCVPNTLLNKMTIKGSERRHNESVSKCSWRDEKKTTSPTQFHGVVMMEFLFAFIFDNIEFVYKSQTVFHINQRQNSAGRQECIFNCIQFYGGSNSRA